jgi:AbrB family looped-hinge helix DNA binding protein
MPIVTVSSKGQLVIPSSVRKLLRIKPGSKVRMTVSDAQDKVILEPLPDDPIDALCGIFKGHPASLTDALLRDRQEDHAREEEKLARLFRNHGDAEGRG